jgi:hypothetical protein
MPTLGLVRRWARLTRGDPDGNGWLVQEVDRSKPA